MCRPIIQELFAIPHAANVFGMPVDPVLLNLPDYFSVIKCPMDLGMICRHLFPPKLNSHTLLGLVLKRLDTCSYRDLHYFVSDVHLTFNNAMTYNPKNSDVYALAKSLKREFDLKYKQKTAEFERMVEQMRRSSDDFTC